MAEKRMTTESGYNITTLDMSNYPSGSYKVFFKQDGKEPKVVTEVV